MKNLFPVLFLIILFAACRKETKDKNLIKKNPVEFNFSSLQPDFKPVKEIKGQLVYLPVYSNVPYQIDTLLFDMSAFVAIHNIDLHNPIYLTKVSFFNQEGKFVDDFLKEKVMKILPLATKDFYIPYEDKSGTGANFLIEWISDTLVCEPLIESVTICLKPNNTVAILSQGKIIKEKP